MSSVQLEKTHGLCSPPSPAVSTLSKWFTAEQCYYTFYYVHMWQL